MSGSFRRVRGLPDPGQKDEVPLGCILLVIAAAIVTLVIFLSVVPPQ